MLNKEQIFKAVELKKEGKSLREIEEILHCNKMELSFTLNTYNILKEEFDNRLEKYKEKVNTIDTSSGYEVKQLQKQKEEFEEEKQKWLEREAWGKLFVKNIIYKYRNKDINLQKKYKKYVALHTNKIKTLKEEHFTAWADLQACVKQRLDLQQELKNTKILCRIKYFMYILLGGATLIVILDALHYFKIGGF